MIWPVVARYAVAVLFGRLLADGTTAAALIAGTAVAAIVVRDICIEWRTQ